MTATRRAPKPTLNRDSFGGGRSTKAGHAPRRHRGAEHEQEPLP